ncbi:MAG: TonB-dependent receptor [Arenicellales bacterium]|nr:TonB-dependent receptor [Arenicellales bacterium]
MKRALVGSSCMLCAALSPHSYATKTPEVVVTGTQHPVSVESLPAATTVYTREQIEELQFQNLPELLNQSVGLDVVRNGGPGQPTSLFIRGTEADHVLVLVDGIRVGAATVGTTAFQLIPLYQIERIEILRGPQSSLYGSEAIGGVLQIFTRKGRAPTSYGVTAAAGSFNTKEIGANINGESNGTKYSVAASYIDTDGFDAREPVPGPFGFSQPDDDGHDNASIQVRVGHETKNGSEFDAFILRAEGTTEFDGTFEDKSDHVQQVVGASATFDPTSIWETVLRVGESRDETDNFAPDGSFSSTFNTKRKQAYWINHVEVTPQGILTLGADYLDDQVDSTSNFAETSRDNVGVYAQYVGDYGSQQITASIRNDDNEAFGSETTGGIGWGYVWPNAVRVYLRAGNAFKAPTFNELYFPNFGNPNLGPETAVSVEAGLEGRPQWGRWVVRLFRTEVDDLIVTTLNPATGMFSPENIEDARIDGIEVEIAALLAGWNVSATLTLLDPENRQTGAELPRRAKESFTFNVTKQINKFVFGGRLLAKGDRFDDTLNTIPVDSYVVVDLLAEYLLNRNFSIKARVGNVFDEDYQEVSTFNTPGRNVLFTVQYEGGPAQL